MGIQPLTHLTLLVLLNSKVISQTSKIEGGELKLFYTKMATLGEMKLDTNSN